MPRAVRVAPGGTVFHALNRANARSQLFDGDGDYAAFERALAAALALVPSMRLLCYCLMPNHWHLVLWPRGDGDLARFMQRLTVTHVRRWHEHRGTTGHGHLYQGTYKSFPVQRDEHFLILCRYVERNPLRAGLVRRAQDWRWSSLWRRLHERAGSPAGVGSRTGAGERGAGERGDAGAADALPPLTDWPVDRPPDWLRRVNTPQTAAEEQRLRECLRRGRPFGAEPWQKRTAASLGLQSTFRPRGRPRKKPD